MAPERHALLGCSKAHQWLECTPSARWELDFPEEKPSEAAAEGTLAHAIAEFFLWKAINGRKARLTKAFKEHPLFKPVMLDHVATYVDTVMEIYSGVKNPVAYVEQKLNLSHLIPDGFGTADCVIIGDGVMHVCDLKYGKGVPVSAENNPQLRLYALGALEEFSVLYDIREVVTHIIQPRLDSISEERMTVEAINQWAVTYVSPRARMAYRGEGEFNPGESQCRWCRCKNMCRAYQERMFEIAKARFTATGEERAANTLSYEEIGQVLESIEELKRWATGVADWALEQATDHGVKFPGWKLVEGRSVRKIINEGEVVSILDNAGYTTDKTCKLRGLTELESLVGKKDLAELLGDRIIKPRGKPVLAKESDKRPELSTTQQAADVFNAVND